MRPLGRCDTGGRNGRDMVMLFPRCGEQRERVMLSASTVKVMIKAPVQASFCQSS